MNFQFWFIFQGGHDPGVHSSILNNCSVLLENKLEGSGNNRGTAWWDKIKCNVWNAQCKKIISGEGKTGTSVETGGAWQIAMPGKNARELDIEKDFEWEEE